MSKLLRIDTIHGLEDFFHQKKMVTMEAIGREASETTIDIYIRGFLRQLMEKVQEMAPELRTPGLGIVSVLSNSTNGGYFNAPNDSLRATPSMPQYPSQSYPIDSKPHS